MNEAATTIKALSEDFDPHIIRTKPGSDRKPATKYVSHGSVTKRLNAVAPGWSSRVVEMHTYMDQKGVMKCAGVTLELTIPFVGTRQEFGTASQPRDFGTDAKNALSDALKRCAMRFGVALDLWESMDEDDEDAQPAPPPANQTTRDQSRRSDPPSASRPAAALTAAGSPNPHGTALLEIIRDDEADPADRKRALHNYFGGAATVTGLNQRAEAVAKSGLPQADRDAGYHYHLARLSTEEILTPASAAG